MKGSLGRDPIEPNEQQFNENLFIIFFFSVVVRCVCDISSIVNCNNSTKEIRRFDNGENGEAERGGRVKRERIHSKLFHPLIQTPLTKKYRKLRNS